MTATPAPHDPPRPNPRRDGPCARGPSGAGRLIRAAAVLLALAGPAAAEPLASLRIEAELAALGHAPAIEAMPGDIQALNRLPGPALEVTLHPRFDAAVADMTRGRTGQRLIISVCGRVVMEPILRDEITVASFLLTADDVDFLREVDAALRAPSCAAVPSS